MKLRWIVAVLMVAVLAGVGVLVAAEAGKVTKDTKCPVSGKAASAEQAVDFGGGKVYFCCGNCPKEFDKNKDKYKAKANHQLVQTGQMVQACCPMTQKPTKEGTEVEIDGVKVAFCCANCKGTVAKLKGDEQLAKVFADISKCFKPAGK